MSWEICSADVMGDLVVLMSCHGRSVALMSWEICSAVLGDL